MSIKSGSLSELEKKVNLSGQLDIDYGKHRSGWRFAIDSIRELHNDNGYLFDTFLEKSFTWDPENIKKNRVPWIGVLHVPPNVPRWFMYEQSNESIFKLGEWEDSIELCKGIYVLSEYHKAHLEKYVDVPVNTLFHPTGIPDTKWDPDSFLHNGDKKVIQIGWWLRKFHSIFRLELNPELYRKVFIKPDSREFLDRLIAKEKSILVRKGEFREEMYDSVEMSGFQSNEEYDRMLTENIIFVDLYDTSANNLIIECMARNTPVLVNPLPAVIEYLGEEYPLYFNSLDEAAEKAENVDLIVESHQYLQNHVNQKKLKGSYFRESLINSPIYSNLDPDIGSEFVRMKNRIALCEEKISDSKNNAIMIQKELFQQRHIKDEANEEIKNLKAELAGQKKLVLDLRSKIRSGVDLIGVLKMYKKELTESILLYEKRTQLIFGSGSYRIGRLLASPISKLREQKNKGCVKKEKKPTLAFIDHSFHKKSKATQFLINILKKQYKVEIFWDHSWDNGPKTNIFELARKQFHRILFFQSYNYSEEELRFLKKEKIILVPMYDGSAHYGFKFWKKYKNVKIINFSSVLNKRLISFGMNSRYFQYFPDPKKIFKRNRSIGKKLVGFFWQRTRVIDWELIKKLIGDTRFSRIYIHTESDPRVKNDHKPDENDVKRYKIKFISWKKSKADYLSIINKCNVYFAPRLYEGIGMSFLEAMALGICVVAPDHPTMNEYITHNENGLLYSKRDVKSLDFSDVERLGKNAGKLVRTGRSDYNLFKKELLAFVGSTSTNRNLIRYNYNSIRNIGISRIRRILKRRNSK